MPIIKQNTKISKNLQMTQPYPINLTTNDNKNIEQTASTLKKNKSNASDASVTNKKTKISNEVPPLTIENIIDSIILTPSYNAEISSSEHQTLILIQQQDITNTSTMKIDSTTLAEPLNNSNGNHSYKPSYVDTTRNNNCQTAAKPVTVQNRPPQTNQTPPNQT
ncbi:5181_t:CDS:2, partial [Funneliformis geosporum]